MAVDLDGYDLIWAGPPCQGYSELRHAPGGKWTPRLIAFTRYRLVQSGAPYVIENVEGARAHMENPITLCGTMFGLGAQGCELRRHRLFESNVALPQPACRHSDGPVIGVYGGHARKRSAKHGGRGTRDEWRGGHRSAMAEAMGIDWATTTEMSEAIPPAYAEYLGRHIRRMLAVAAAA